jgi:hypothetical protein
MAMMYFKLLYLRLYPVFLFSTLTVALHFEQPFISVLISQKKVKFHTIEIYLAALLVVLILISSHITSTSMS